MKKWVFTLSALTLATSAQAYSLIDNKETGTQFEADGSLRLTYKNVVSKEDGRDKTQRNYPIQNNGSRFGFKLTQQLGNDFYGVGRVQFRFRSRADGSLHGFYDPYTHYAYGAIGHKKYGELSYGNLLSLGDSVRQTDLPNTLSVSDGLLPGTVRSAAQYVYKGIDNLQLGVLYGGYDKRNSNTTVATNPRKNIFATNALYRWNLADDAKLNLGLGYARDRLKNTDGSTFDRNSVGFGSALTYGKTTYGLDLEQRKTDPSARAGEITEREVRTLVYHRLTSDWRIYGQYAYKTKKTENNQLRKEKTNQYLLGTEYQIVPKYLKTFVEWRADRKKTEVVAQTSHRREMTTVIGLRAYW
ncbi:hypothetical protein A4G18_02590 [Pasteurellaceae bacterium Pebbles2]|nr:hypothetical protein [Pasteurellaceae bacterium Pebbles2]